ncbi:hypothetical protein AVEN_41899-1 [Araneus ventricosus]|uniref:Uncharacterized protein n=1 Tax=Araneus ventricosus TaxID=182803 RepID=A0A4Y2ACA9_ARAVE|nr:hypothetical protein AVEN_41899-1 [Araneus ventricosus]
MPRECHNFEEDGSRDAITKCHGKTNAVRDAGEEQKLREQNKERNCQGTLGGNVGSAVLDYSKVGGTQAHGPDIALLIFGDHHQQQQTYSTNWKNALNKGKNYILCFLSH